MRLFPTTLTQAWYWDLFGLRVGYWRPCYQSGPRAGQDRGFGFYACTSRWKKSFLVMPGS